MSDDDFESWRALTRRSASDSRQVAIRFQLARTTAETFSSVGTELHLAGHILGGDRVSGRSPFGHGNDEIVAVSLLLRITGQLVSASADLFEDGRHYAAAALLRQIVVWNISPGLSLRVIATRHGGCAVPKRNVENSLRRRNCVMPPRDDSGARTMDIIASSVDTLCRSQPS
jgi:hypothetical protein